MSAGATSRSGIARDHDVVVVGAGLAGLRAATDLVAAGRDVVVLESRARVGGRVWSHRFANGQWCERGAEFVDSAHAEVLALADRLGIERTDVTSGCDDEARLLDVGGRSQPFRLHHSLAGELARWRSALADLAARVGGGDPVDTSDAAALDAAPLSELVRELDLGLMTRIVVGRDIRTEYMVAPDEVSQLMAGWMTSLHLRSPGGCETIRLRGGNDQLATGLAEPLGGRVRTSTAVVAVDPASGTVQLADGAALRGRAIVLALPLPVAARVWSTMPPEVARVGYGIGGKVSLQFGRRVWRDDGYDGSVWTERAWGELWETTDGQDGDAGVLTALLSSNDGAALVSLPDVEQRILGEVARIFPGTRGLAGERVRTDWTNDPNSLGAYAAYGPGQLLAAWPLLQRRYETMVLAGEYTDLWCGYMEGALRSGARAARQILDDAAG